MVEEKKEAKEIYAGKNIMIYLDSMKQEDGRINSFYILTVHNDTVGYFRDNKGNLAYGKRPSRALPINKEYTNELKQAIASLK